MARKKIALMITLLSAALILSISLVTAKNNNKAEEPLIQSTEPLMQTTLQVSNLSCGSCLAAIESELQKYDGMVEMRADLRQGLVAIGHTAAFEGTEIAKAITAIGYPAKVLSDSVMVASQEQDAAGGAVRRYGCGGGCCGPKPPSEQ